MLSTGDVDVANMETTQENKRNQIISYHLAYLPTEGKNVIPYQCRSLVNRKPCQLHRQHQDLDSVDNRRVEIVCPVRDCYFAL